MGGVTNAPHTRLMGKLFVDKQANFGNLGILSLLVLTGTAFASNSPSARADLALAPLDSAPDLTGTASPSGGIWQGEVGEGFRPTLQTLSLEPGFALGVQAFGGQQFHDLGILSLSYGHMWGHVMGDGHWYHGNWEVRAEVFGAAQFSPNDVPVGGIAPHIRYNLATGSRWVPFVDLGAGVSASGIGPPDNSGTFEFNLQANVGTHFFLRDDLALTVETGLLHLSCAGIHDPNQGVNTIKGLFGVTWFY
jgi:lipid A 3-O-deacylase